MKSAPNPESMDPRIIAEALLFIKPHVFRQAMDPAAVIGKIKDHLEREGISVVEEKVVTGAQVREHNLAEDHYLVISRSARSHPGKLAATQATREKFQSEFNESWEGVIENGHVLNPFEMMDAVLDSGTALEIKKIWESVSSAVAIAPGAYVKKVITGNKEYFLFNGFYPAMKEDFEKEDAQIHCMIVHFDTTILSWSNFRDKIIGKTNPADALESSVRGSFYREQQAFGLSMSDNANLIHASAGPLEAAREELLWMGKQIEDISFFKLLASEGFTKEKIEWLSDAPIVDYKGVTDTIFEHTEKKSPVETLEILKEIS